MDLIDERSTRTRNVLNNRAPVKTVQLSPKRGVGAAMAPATARIYRAPQAAIRSKPKKESGNGTRRRRGDSFSEPKLPVLHHGPSSGAAPPTPKRTSHYESSLDAPCLWRDELDDSHSDRHYLGSPRQRRTIRTFQVVRPGSDDLSDTVDVEDFTNHTARSSHYSYDNKYTGRKKNVAYRFLVNNFQGIVQFMVIIIFGMMIFDSHHRVHKHKVQLQQYDEERAHILEQMMWIDQAAKKVHKKYAQKELWNDLNGDGLLLENETQLREEAEGLRDAIRTLQLRVQLNARDKIEQRFGENPVQVSLALDQEGANHLVLALSDDTPHAAQTLLEQVDRKIWDNIQLQKLQSGAIQLSTGNQLPSISPVLEFVESSRSCHQVGSVVLHQLEAASMDLNIVVLRIHTQEGTPMEDGDVCIGKVVKGLDLLNDIEGLPTLASVH